MALGAEARAGWSLGVRIVPVGLVYRAKPRFRSRVAVWVGEALCPARSTGLAALHARDERAAVAELNGEIERALRAVTLDLERWEDLPLLELAERILFSEREGRLERVQAFARALRELRRRDPAPVEALGLRIQAFGERLARLGLTAHDVPWRLERTYRPAVVLRFVLRNLLVLLVGLPLAALGAALWFLPHRLAGALPKRFSSPDLLATSRLLAGALFFPLWLLLGCALVAASWGPAWAGALALAAPPLGLVALAFADWRVDVRSEVRTFLRLASRRRLRALLLEERAALASELEALRERL